MLVIIFLKPSIKIIRGLLMLVWAVTLRDLISELVEILVKRAPRPGLC